MWSTCAPGGTPALMHCALPSLQVKLSAGPLLALPPPQPRCLDVRALRTVQQRPTDFRRTSLQVTQPMQTFSHP
jgi:hypothetical protein